MKRVTLPGTDLSISRLSFGSASLHHLPTSARRQSLLSAALDHGFSHFDTAPSYGYGISEWELGRFLRTTSARVTVASKVGLYPPTGPTHSTMAVWLRKALGKLMPSLSAALVDWSVSQAAKSLEHTLRTLGRDCQDILFLHEPTLDLLETDELGGWLIKQRTLGKLRYWGLAGPLERFAPLVRQKHPLGQVLQIPSDVDGSGIRFLAEAGREPQITYGCFAAARRAGVSLSVSEILRVAFERNPAGSVLVSTLKVSHLRELAQLAE
jgi:aryl-alcohol dehydrogenase-like predicted oxidoreductase